MIDSRQKLVDMIKASGEYLISNADEIVDKAELKADLSIWIRFDKDAIPTVEITQTHYMTQVLAVLRRPPEK